MEMCLRQRRPVFSRTVSRNEISNRPAKTLDLVIDLLRYITHTELSVNLFLANSPPLFIAPYRAAPRVHAHAHSHKHIPGLPQKSKGEQQLVRVLRSRVSFLALRRAYKNSFSLPILKEKEKERGRERAGNSYRRLAA